MSQQKSVCVNSQVLLTECHMVKKCNNRSQLIQNVCKIEVKKTLTNCKTKAREEISVPVHPIFMGKFWKMYSKEYDLVGGMPKCNNVKTRLCRERQNVLMLVFSEKSLLFDNNALIIGL